MSTGYSKRITSKNDEFCSVSGNHLLHVLTANKNYTLRIDLEDFDREQAFAIYSEFAVGSKEDGFRLTLSGYNGTAG